MAGQEDTSWMNEDPAVEDQSWMEEDPAEEPARVDPTANVNGDTSGYAGGPPVDINQMSNNVPAANPEEEGFTRQLRREVFDEEAPEPTPEEKIQLIRERIKDSKTPEDLAALDDLEAMERAYKSSAFTREAEDDLGKQFEISTEPVKIPGIMPETQKEMNQHDKVIEAAQPVLDDLYNRKVKQPQTSEKDYEYFASGPNAYRKTLPEDYVPGIEDYDEGGLGSGNPAAFYETLVGLSKKSGKDNETLLKKMGNAVGLDVGDYVLNGRVIPKPGDYKAPKGALSGDIGMLGMAENMASNQDNYVSSMAQDAVRNIARKSALVGAALFDKSMGYDDSRTTKSVMDNFAKPAAAKTLLNQAARDLTQLAVPGLVGAKVGTAATTGLANSPKAAVRLFGNSLAGFTSMFFAAWAMNPEDETLVTGKNALASYFKGVPIEEDGQLSTEVITNTLNQIVESMALEQGVSLTATGVRKGFEFIVKRPLLEPIWALLGGQETAEKLLARGIVNKYDPNAKRETFLELAKNVTEGAKKKISVDTSGFEDFADAGQTVKGIDINLTSMQALAETKRKEIAGIEAQLRDTNLPPKRVQQLQEELITKKEQLTRANELDKGSNVRGLVEVLNKNQTNREAIDQAGQQALTSRGGRETTQEMTGVIADDDVAQLNALTTRIRELDNAETGEIVSMDKQINDAIASDSGFKKQIEAFNKDVDLAGAGLGVREPRKRVVVSLIEGVATMKTAVSKAFKSLPDGVMIEDMDSFSGALGPVLKEKALPPETVTALKQMIEKEMGGVAEDGIDDFEFIEAALDKSVFDSKFVLNELLPSISAEMSRLSKAGPGSDVGGKINLLYNLKQNIIEKQLDALAKSDMPGAKEAAEGYYNAKELYKSTVGKYGNDPKTPIGQLFDAFDEARYSGDDSVKGINEALLQTDEALRKAQIGGILKNSSGKTVSLEQTGQRVIDSISDTEEAYGEQFFRFVNSRFVPESARDDMFEAQKGLLLKPIRDAINSGEDLSSLTVKNLLAPFEKSGGLFKGEYPEEVAELEGFLTKIKNLQGSKKDKLAELDLLKDKADQALEDVKTKAAFEFITNISGDAKLYKSIDAADAEVRIVNFLKDSKNADKVNEMVEQIRKSGNPAAQAGLEKGYIKLMLDTAKPRGGEYLPANIDDIINKSDEYMNQLGTKIFSNYPDPSTAKFKMKELDVIRDFLGFASQGVKNKGVIADQPMQESALLDDAKAAYGRISMFLFGVLNTKATISRNYGNVAMKQIGTLSPENIRLMQGALYANPEKFAQTLIKIADDYKSKRVSYKTVESFMTMFPKDVWNNSTDPQAAADILNGAPPIEKPETLLEKEKETNPGKLKVPDAVRLRTNRTQAEGVLSGSDAANEYMKKRVPKGVQ